MAYNISLHVESKRSASELEMFIDLAGLTPMYTSFVLDHVYAPVPIPDMPKSVGEWRKLYEIYLSRHAVIDYMAHACFLHCVCSWICIFT